MSARSEVPAAAAWMMALCAALAMTMPLSGPSSAAEPVPDAVRQATGACALAVGWHATATAITAPDAVVLDDGTEVKLAGLIGASAHDTAAANAGWPPENDATRALSDLVLGRTLSIHPVTPRPDRYGRIIAHVFVERDGDRSWVQEQLLAQGRARAHGIAELFVCADELLAREREARLGKVGIWANAAYFERAAYRTRELMRLRGTFQIVSGRVRRVSEIKSAIYLNFGADWRSDFTARIKIGKGVFSDPEFAAMLRALEGRRVRVRGWIDRRNGPYIEIGHPSEIEILDESSPLAAAPDGAYGSDGKRPEP